ncbi:MAG TPA: NUDIX domain-containing protein [Flavitalea sp.]|nr:NUDIX domain-containing protein [Flavitalea sp.]
MPPKSAGILLYKKAEKGLKVLLVHPGGPYFQRKDEGSWSIPKGEFDNNEAPLAAAIREFREELGTEPPGPFTQLNPVKQKSGKIVHAWISEGEFDPALLVCNTFTIEWPKGSGKMKSFPEIDKADWFSIEEARTKILESQRSFLNELEEKFY